MVAGSTTASTGRELAEWNPDRAEWLRRASFRPILKWWLEPERGDSHGGLF